jgi:hypothetical protein
MKSNNQRNSLPVSGILDPNYRLYSNRLNLFEGYLVIGLSIFAGIWLIQTKEWHFPFTSPYYISSYLTIRIADLLTTARVTKLSAKASAVGWDTSGITELNPYHPEPPTIKDMLSLRPLTAQLLGILGAILHPIIGLMIILISLRAVVGNYQLGDDLQKLK